MRERDEQRDAAVCACTCPGAYLAVYARARKRGPGAGVCVEPEVRAGSAGASVRQRRHRFGLHAPIIGRLIGRYSATDSALHRFRVARPRNHTRFRENAARLMALPHAAAKLRRLENIFFSRANVTHSLSLPEAKYRGADREKFAESEFAGSSHRDHRS